MTATAIAKRRRPAALEPLEGRVLFATVPAGFADTSGWASGLSNPTAMAFAPDGRLFVTQQAGALRVVKPNPGGASATVLATPFLTKAVDSSGERGLLGVAFDPNFLSNGYVYVYYTVPGAGVHNRVSRFTAVDADPNPDVYVPGDTAVAGSEMVLMDLDPLSNATNHNGGAIHFGLDGKLYVAVGENANPSNSQTLNNRLGKMLRINSDGSIPTDNPFYTTATGANRSIWAMGLRNPFTFAVQPGTGRIFINDVGQSSFEEINEGRAGANYGWPTTEGDFNQAQFPQFTRPIHFYGRNVGTVIAGGTFYNPAVQNFPSAYLGDYFFSDNGSGFIHKLEGPVPSTPAQSASNFATGVSGPVDLQVGSDGALYYLARGAGRVGRIAYTADLRPTVSAPADQQVTAGDPATFTVTAGGDPPLSFRWQRQSPGEADFTDIPDATGSSYTLPTTTRADNGAKFRVVVTNNFGSATSAPATLTVNLAPPPSVVARHLFYNNSVFDGNDPAANAADDAAIATDKQAVLPGQKSTFANVTSYSKGINGVMLDLEDLRETTQLTAANFRTQTSTDGRQWAEGPAPAVTVRRLITDGGPNVDRATLIWPDGAIAERWLEVLFNPYVGAPVAFGIDLSWYGNLSGETGDGATPDQASVRVSAIDLAGTRGQLNSAAAIDNRFDFNRDGRINALDLAIVKRGLNRELVLFTAPTPPVATAGSSLARDLDDLLA